jgi:ribosomal protein S18 acetylase RimI-like enzyme
MKPLIRTIQTEDLDSCTSLAKSGGWVSQDRVVFEIFRVKDPHGCFLAELAGEPVGMIIATGYGKPAYLGTLIVKEACRGEGIGRELLLHAIQYLQTKGAESIYLDAAPKAIPLYQRNGFQPICPTLRFDGSCIAQPHPQVRPMLQADLGDLFHLDKIAFGADRSYFLERRFQHWPKACAVYQKEGKLAGFITGRNFSGGVAVGPWIVTDAVESPLRMLQAIAMFSGENILHLSVLENNTAAVKLLRDSGFTERDDTHLRMVYGKPGTLGQSIECFAIGALSKG